MKVTCLFVAIFGLALIVGCSETPSGPSTSSVIMPLAVGNEWVHTITYYNPDGSIDRYIDDKLVVLGSHFDTVLGDTVFSFNHDIEACNRKDGYWQSFSLTTPIRLFAKYPASKDEIFRIDTVMQNVGTTDSVQTWIYTYSYKGESVSIEVPAGNFNCIWYQIKTVAPGTLVELREDYYFEPNIGLVLNVRYVRQGYNAIYAKRQLISYQLN